MGEKLSPDDFKTLVAAGLSTDQIALVMEMMERDSKAMRDADEARRQKARDRVSKWRERHGNVYETSRKVTERLTREPARVEDKTSNSEIEPQEENKKRASALSPEFDQFWELFPNKVGKPKARSSFEAAARKAAPAAIIAGLQRYIATKPPDRPWLNPATFLNQERWADQPAAVQPQARASPPPPRINPTLAAALKLKEQMDAVSPSEIEGNHPPPRLVAVGGRVG
jgi:hypothetical protein